MRKELLLLLLSLLAFVPGIRAQVTTEPAVLEDDSENVVVYFHADQGNKELMGLDPYTNTMYVETGCETINYLGKTAEQDVPNWDADSEKFQLTYVSDNLWKLYIGNLREFYGITDTKVAITRLKFIFRTPGSEKQGLTADGQPIYVTVSDSGFQLLYRCNRTGNVIEADKKYTFTANTTVEADIKIYINDVLEAQTSTPAKTLAASNLTFTEHGSYDIKFVATANGKTLERHLYMYFPGASQPASDTSVPAMGVTKNSDGTYTFCIAAPEKETALLYGSWNNFRADNSSLMEYVDAEIDGGTFRYFKATIPASTTGTAFSYYYNIDAKSVGDPYARLILDPYNDKYISSSVYPDMPAYPEGKVPTNTVVAYYADNLLDYNWNVTEFTGASKDNLVIYEMLFRDFTGTEGAARGNGTVRAAIEKIPYLKELGINAVELLPINEFNGNNSWGYNPNFYFAVDKAYGTPQDYKEFIDKCHAEGIAVILDVVFNQSDGLHPWYQLYSISSNPFYNQTAPHAYSVLNDWRQEYPLVQIQWKDMLKFWLSEYKVDGFRFDLVKGLGDNSSYTNSGDNATNAYNASRVARMKSLHDAMREVNPNAYFINENLAGSKEENEMAEDGELNWANVNDPGCQFAMGYSSGASLNRMWAARDGRTAGSTVAYLESHDEQRLAYKQDQWGVDGVKGNHKVSMQRLGSAAAQMILVPGSHMIWMFSEMGNAQNTKSSSGDNNTSPKIVNWSLLDDPDNKALYDNYCELISIRLKNQELFATTADYSLSLATWAAGRSIVTSAGDKELYAVINPNTDKDVTVTVKFKQSDNSAYQIYSKSYDSDPTFDAAARTVTVQPGCYVVICTDNVRVSVDNISNDIADQPVIYAANGCINVRNCNGDVAIFNMNGMTVAAGNGAMSVPVAPGMYVVRAAGRVVKIAVR